MDETIKEEVNWFENLSSKTKNSFIISNYTSYDFNYNVCSFPTLDRQLVSDLFMLDIFEPRNIDRKVIFPKNKFDKCIYEKIDGCKIIYSDKEKSLEIIEDVSIKVSNYYNDEDIIVRGTIGNKLSFIIPKRKELKNISFLVNDKFKRGDCYSRLFVTLDDRLRISFSKNDDDTQWPLYIGGEIIIKDYDYSIIGVFFVRRKDY